MWSVILTIFAFLISFSLLVLIHEFGHYWMAKRSGMKVEEFGMGLPPRMFGKKIGETIYSLNWIPFGGFVRIYGEDSADPKMLRSKRSFVGKSLRSRILVVIGGVVMNFLLAIVLLSIGFTVGMKPLLTPSEVLPAIANGQIVVDSGLVVEEVEEGSLADINGIEEGDKLVMFDGDYLSSAFIDGLDGEGDVEGTYQFLSDGELVSFDKGDEELGVVFADDVVLPRLEVYDLPEEDYLKELGLLEGDRVLAVNGMEVFDVDQFNVLSLQAVLSGELRYEVLRGGERFVLKDVIPKKNKVIISEVVAGSVAEEVGLLTDDILLFVDNKEVDSVRDFQGKITEAYPGKRISLLIERDGQMVNLMAIPEDGKLGVVLSNLRPVSFGSEASFFTAYNVESAIEEKEVKYVWYQAPVVAVAESYEIVKLSAVSFFDMIGGLFAGEGVPDTVGGPVKIAYLTHLTLQDGWVDFMRLIALISLALAALNILPIPALDGGRLLFLIIEGVTGKRVSSKFEMYLHALGFVLLIGLIFLITYSDIKSLV